MRDGKNIRYACTTMSSRIAVMVATAVLVPAFVFAAETDRVTVEDPATGAVMFRVTSGGNVTGTSFNGDGSGLTNVAHWKGTWNGVPSYSKDDCVNYGGSSYIAVQQNMGVQPDLNPASWAVLAQRGTTGATGPAGPQGPPGPAGASDTQTDILSKLAAPIDYAQFVLQQGATEPVSSPKIVVKDKDSAAKFVVAPNGAVGIGTGLATYPLTIDSGIATGVPAGVGMAMLSGSANKERMEIRSFGPITDSAPTLQGKSAAMINGVPNTRQNQILMAIGGGGYDSAGNMVLPNMALIQMKAEEAWTSTAQGTNMIFHTTAPGGITRTEKLRITGAGNIGIGSISPSQKLEVAGGIRINTAAAKPGCDVTSRGTFWFTQGDADDVAFVCAKVSGVYTWRALW